MSFEQDPEPEDTKGCFLVILLGTVFILLTFLLAAHGKFEINFK